MKLGLGFAQINDIQFASEPKMENGATCVNAEELKTFSLGDENLKSIEFEIVKPGESVRIMPVKNAIEPRVKVNGGRNLFLGVISKVEIVGSRRTNVLKGSVVVTIGKTVGFQEGIIDMCGEGAKYTPFSQLDNLVAVCEPTDGLAEHTHEKAVRFAGFKAADYIGKLVKDTEPDEVKVYEACSAKEGIEKYSKLPKVAYVLMLQSQGLMHDTYVYGADMKQSLPIISNPTELMGGVVLSGSCVSACNKNITYHHPNNLVVVNLLEQHGKTLNSVGVIIINENVYLIGKTRSPDWTSKLCELLGADGTTVSQEGFGNPDTDLIMNRKKIEGKGVKTAIIIGEYTGCDGASQFLTDVDASANAVATDGSANIVINLPAMDKVIGYPEVADIIAGGFDGSLREDGSIVAELQVITGVTNEMGFSKLSAR